MEDFVRQQIGPQNAVCGCNRVDHGERRGIQISLTVFFSSVEECKEQMSGGSLGEDGLWGMGLKNLEYSSPALV